jgi:hypothetical protein
MRSLLAILLTCCLTLPMFAAPLTEAQIDQIVKPGETYPAAEVKELLLSLSADWAADIKRARENAEEAVKVAVVPLLAENQVLKDETGRDRLYKYLFWVALAAAGGALVWAAIK